MPSMSRCSNCQGRGCVFSATRKKDVGCWRCRGIGACLSSPAEGMYYLCYKNINRAGACNAGRQWWEKRFGRDQEVPATVALTTQIGVQLAKCLPMRFLYDAAATKLERLHHSSFCGQSLYAEYSAYVRRNPFVITSYQARQQLELWLLIEHRARLEGRLPC